MFLSLLMLDSIPDYPILLSENIYPLMDIL